MNNNDFLAAQIAQSYLAQSKENKQFDDYCAEFIALYEKAKQTVSEYEKQKRDNIMKPFGDDNNSLGPILK